MENIKPTKVDVYFSYWKTYIQPIEAEKRRVHFNDLLIDVGTHLYGSGFGLELACLFFKEQNPDLAGADQLSDEHII